MLVAFASWLILQSDTADGRPVLVMYMAPTNAMAREFRDLLVRALGDVAGSCVSLMGCGDKKDSDLLEMSTHTRPLVKVWLC